MFLDYGGYNGAYDTDLPHASDHLAHHGPHTILTPVHYGDHQLLHDNYAPPNYSYGYSLYGDSPYEARMDKTETRTGHLTTGGYSVDLPDGRTQVRATANPPPPPPCRWSPTPWTGPPGLWPPWSTSPPRNTTVDCLLLALYSLNNTSQHRYSGLAGHLR